MAATAVRGEVRFRADDIWDTLDDGNRQEVTDGELYVSPPLTLEHQSAVSALHEHVAPCVRRHRAGKVFVAPVGPVLDEHNGLQPDLVYVSAERAGIFAGRGIGWVADLVVEVLPPRRAPASLASRCAGMRRRAFPTTGSSTLARKPSHPVASPGPATGAPAPAARAPCSSRSASPR